METTFMTIHNLTPNANILFASESIVDILGFQPHEVLGKSCFDYFHPDEVPFAKHVHDRGLQMDKAASLHYASIKDKNGEWISCECVFTVVHDVLVACTSIYKRNQNSIDRALAAPAVSRKFASSPRDPRYHMLEHLSTKFKAAPAPSLREPRAALILNRFTRTLTIMFATNVVADILGVTAEQLSGKSFYECIKENCLPDAIRCLESAKANDSIAYLRFWYRDPRRPDELEQIEREASHSSDDDDGGVVLDDHMEIDSLNGSRSPSDHEMHTPHMLADDTRTSSADSSDLGKNSSSAIFDNVQPTRSAASSRLDSSSDSRAPRNNSRRSAISHADIEIEAVVSCTSDGLVVILRRARPLIPSPEQHVASPTNMNGVFAAPWGVNPIHPHAHVPDMQYELQRNQVSELHTADDISRGGPSVDSFMNSIREVAVFAWSLTGINGNIAKYGHGTPKGESFPADGFPVWDPQAQNILAVAPQNQAYQKWLELNQRAAKQKTNEPINQAHSPFVHHRQEQLMRQQYGFGSGPMGSDVPGSSARQYLGPYIGDDGQGPAYFPRSAQTIQTDHPNLDNHQSYNTHDIDDDRAFLSNGQGPISFHSPNADPATYKFQGNGNSNSQAQGSTANQRAGNPNADGAFYSNRYLWH